MLNRTCSGFPVHAPLAPLLFGSSGFFIGMCAMEIIVNGITEVVPPCTIAELADRKGLATGALVVELNQRIIKQEQWPVIRLEAGDRLELLSFVGGG
jgi:sulfur carrier protein